MPSGAETLSFIVIVTQAFMKRLTYIHLVSLSAISCSNLPTEPDQRIGPESLLGARDKVSVELWAGRIKYAAYIGGGEWNYYKHGLMSIDCEWVDHLSSSREPVWWMRARVTIPDSAAVVDLIGECHFVEKVEQPTRGWLSTLDMDYDLGDRVLASLQTN